MRTPISPKPVRAKADNTPAFRKRPTSYRPRRGVMQFGNRVALAVRPGAGLALRHLLPRSGPAFMRMLYTHARVRKCPTSVSPMTGRERVSPARCRGRTPVRPGDSCGVALLERPGAGSRRRACAPRGRDLHSCGRGDDHARGPHTPAVVSPATGRDRLHCQVFRADADSRLRSPPSTRFARSGQVVAGTDVHRRDAARCDTPRETGSASTARHRGSAGSRGVRCASRWIVADQATAAANWANRSPGSGCSSRHVMAIGVSPSCLT